MALLVTEPRSGIYDALPSFERAVGRFEVDFPDDQRQGILAECREVVYKHGLEDIVGVDLKHTHFGMPAGHRLVEVQDPCKHEARMRPQAVAQGEPVTPFAFAWIDDCWQPYEYVADCPVAKDGLAAVEASPGFLAELAEVLLHAQMADILGFHVLHREFMHDAGKGGTLETPGEGPHELVLRPNSAELMRELELSAGETRQVMWHWGSKGPRTHHCGWCSHCHHCGSHCNGHTKK